MIPLSVPHLSGNEQKYVEQCLVSEWISSAGSYVSQFEQDVCALTGAAYAVACINGTAALQVALRIVGVKAGDEVIVPTVTFIAPVNAVHYLGAEPVFMDCDDYYNIDVEKTVEFIEKEVVCVGKIAINRRTKRRVAALVPVHVFGNAANLDPLLSICQDRGIAIVEDACEGIGAFYSKGKLKDRYLGTIGTCGCFSFNGNKIITTGGGGMIVTDQPALAEEAGYLTTQAKDDALRYIHNEIGYNFRLTNIQAAIGVAQLERLNEFITIKKNNFLSYRNAIEDVIGLHLAEVPGYAENNYWMYALQVDEDEYGMGREELLKRFADIKIEMRPLWHPNHLQRPNLEKQAYRIAKALELHKKTLNIPCSINLKKEDIDRVIGCLKRWKK